MKIAPRQIAPRQIAFTILAVAIPLLIYAWGFRPAHEQTLDEIRADIRKKQMQIEQGRAAARRLPMFREEVHRLENAIEKTVVKFPRYLSAQRATPQNRSAWDSDGLHRFEYLLEEVAARHACKIVKVEPGRIDLSRMAILPVEVRLQGSPDQLMAVIHDIETAPQIVSITQAVFVPAKINSIGFVATLYARTKE